MRTTKKQRELQTKMADLAAVIRSGLDRGEDTRRIERDYERLASALRAEGLRVRGVGFGR